MSWYPGEKPFLSIMKTSSFLTTDLEFNTVLTNHATTNLKVNFGFIR